MRTGQDIKKLQAPSSKLQALSSKVSAIRSQVLGKAQWALALSLRKSIEAGEMSDKLRAKN